LRARLVECGAFDPAVRRNQLLGKGCQLNAAAAHAAYACARHGVSERVIKIVEQLPGTAVAQAQFAGGLRQGARPFNVLKERDLAGAERTYRPEVDSQPNVEPRRFPHVPMLTRVRSPEGVLR